jgi:hypothetical protein
MAFALSYLRYDLSSLTIFLVRGQTVQDAHPPDKQIVHSAYSIYIYKSQLHG